MKKRVAIMLMILAACVFSGCQSGPNKTVNSYTVTYDKNGGDTDVSPASKTVTEPASTVGALPSPPQKAGYVFTGWNTASDGSGTAFDANTAVTANLSVYAQWRALEVYTVAFDTDGGGAAANPVSITEGKSMDEQYPALPAKNNFYFDGWFDGAKRYGRSTPITGNTHLKAKWIDGTAAAEKAKFHIYLCFGQSNMEGAGGIEAQDRTGVDERFQFIASDNVNAKSRKLGEWYVAEPPLCGSHGLGPVDYFGRTLTAEKTDIKVGAIVVGVGGAALNLFYRDYDAVQNYLAINVKKTEPWIINGAKGYDNYPYGRMIAMAHKAQESGVIKGILLHQGESGWVNDDGVHRWGDKNWGNGVKRIYDDLLKDLDLEPNSVPLLAGQVVSDGDNGADTIAMVNNLPNIMPGVAYVIDSKGLSKKDGLHFDSEGYRGLGRRYAAQMLELLAK